MQGLKGARTKEACVRKSDKRLNAGSVSVCTMYSEFTAVWDREIKSGGAERFYYVSP